MQDFDPERAAARENLCRFLAACYYQPGIEFAEEKVFASMLDAATRIHPHLAAHARRLGEEFSAAGPASLLLDYTQLFLGPTRIAAKPYGSAWLEGEQILLQDSTLAVEELYAQGGFELDADFRELPDHIAVELEFLYLLIYRENEARRMSDLETLTAVRDLRAHFLDQHLGAWVGAFTAAVQSGARSEFYRELAELTDRFVRMEAGRLRATA